MGTFEIEVKANENIFALVYLSELCSMDLLTLLMLYNKYGEDLFFIFFLLSGKKVAIPKITKLARIKAFAKELIDNPNPEIKSKQEQAAYDTIKKLITRNGTLLVQTRIDPNDTEESRISL